MSADDKYPPESGRRRFVKGVVGSASLASLGTVGAVGMDLTTNPTGAGGGPTTFFGIENIAGPAPRPMPQIPIEIDDEGYILGRYPEVQEVEQQGQTIEVAEEEIGGTTYGAAWFQYCGVQGYAGLSPSYDGDNYLRYSSSPPYEWQSEEVSAGDRVHIEDFQDYEEWGNGIGQSGLGKPAAVTWRSQDTENTLPVQVLRSPIVERRAEDDEWLSAATNQGVMAWLNKCTHFCCVPSGFKTSTYQNADNNVYCQCHQSIYDPFSIVEQQFLAFSRPE